jgi:CxxC motif-containing protein (DUF1111 family)
MTAMLLRVSVPGAGKHGESKPDPTYGGQIQGQAIPGVTPEGDAFVDYKEIAGQFADGEKYSLRKPDYRISNLGYGPLSSNVLISPRVAPYMIGLGLLEAVPEETLRSLADPDDRDHDGISGRMNLVWDKLAGKIAVGRFGWKAEQPSILLQTATAFVEDIGITSSVMPSENYTSREESCARAATGGHPEVSDKILQSVVSYSRTLAVPARRNITDPAVQRGKQLFAEARCAACHVPQLKTGASAGFPELSNQTIRPYTDLLLHDMGEGLGDDRPVFAASGREWRTPPLWGLGLVSKVNGHTFLLHDGRARNTTEAILWHDGEAAKSRDAFRTMPKADREALLKFLESL